jgi:hypothetical protein
LLIAFFPWLSLAVVGVLLVGRAYLWDYIICTRRLQELARQSQRELLSHLAAVLDGRLALHTMNKTAFAKQRFFKLLEVDHTYSIELFNISCYTYSDHCLDAGTL